jgi:hypothetical protein
MEDKKTWRMSIILPEELGAEVVKLRQDERFTRLSYAEIIRKLIEAGLKAGMSKQNETA